MEGSVDNSKATPPLEQLVRECKDFKIDESIAKPGDATIRIVRISEDKVISPAFTCDADVLKNCNLLTDSKHVAYVEEERMVGIRILFEPKYYGRGFSPFSFVLKRLHGVDADKRQIMSSDQDSRQLLTCIYTMKLQSKLNEIETICAENLMKNLTKESCLKSLLQLDELFMKNNLYADSIKSIDQISSSMARFHRSCMNYLLRYFKSLGASKEFQKLSSDTVSELVCNDLLQVSHEEQIRAAVTLWKSADPENRQKVSLEILAKGLRKETKNDVRDLLKAVNLWDHNKIEGSVERPRVHPDTIILFGGQKIVNKKRVALNDVMYWDKVENKITKLTEIPCPNGKGLIGFSACVINDTKIWITGGAYDLESNWNKDDIFIYDTMTELWETENGTLFTGYPLGQNPRRHHGTCTDGEFLYLIGGFGKFRERQKTVLVHRLQRNMFGYQAKAPEIPDLPEPVIQPSCECYKEKLYVVSRDKIYTFDFGAKQWWHMKPSCIGTYDTMVTATPLTVSSFPREERFLQIGIVGNQQPSKPLSLANAEAGKDEFSGRIYRYMKSESRLLTLNGKVYRIEGKTGENTFSYNVYESSVTEIEEKVIVGSKEKGVDEIDSDGLNFCAVVAPVMRLRNS